MDQLFGLNTDFYSPFDFGLADMSFQPTISLGKRTSITETMSALWSGSTDASLPLSTPPSQNHLLDFHGTSGIFGAEGDKDYHQATGVYDYYPFEHSEEKGIDFTADDFLNSAFGDMLQVHEETVRLEDLFQSPVNHDMQFMEVGVVQELDTANRPDMTLPSSPPSFQTFPPPEISAFTQACDGSASSTDNICIRDDASSAPALKMALRSKRKQAVYLADPEQEDSDNDRDPEWQPERASPCGQHSRGRSGVVRRASSLPSRKARPTVPLPKRAASQAKGRAKDPADTSSRLSTPTGDAQTPGKFACHLDWKGRRCSDTFQRFADLTRHLETVHTARKITCPACAGEFSRVDALKRHRNLKCGGKTRKRRCRKFEMVIEGDGNHKDSEDDAD